MQDSNKADREKIIGEFRSTIHNLIEDFKTELSPYEKSEHDLQLVSMNNPPSHLFSASSSPVNDEPLAKELLETTPFKTPKSASKQSEHMFQTTLVHTLPPKQKEPRESPKKKRQDAPAPQQTKGILKTPKKPASELEELRTQVQFLQTSLDERAKQELSMMDVNQKLKEKLEEYKVRLHPLSNFGSRKTMKMWSKFNCSNPSGKMKWMICATSWSKPCSSANNPKWIKIRCRANYDQQHWKFEPRTMNWRR